MNEAECMGPHQRLLLQLACGAIENSGHRLEDLRKTATGTFIAASGTGYGRLLKDFRPAALIGNLPAALAGRIAYALDLRGPAVVLDTACSSSLVAVIEASRRLRSGDVAFALAGGVNIFFLEDQMDSTKLEIIAPDGRSKAFDARANGSGWGEGGGVVLLRRLDEAIEQGDVIHAVIRGGETNQDGARSNGLAAPSPDAQAEVILKTWAEAGIDPEELSYIEGHGTGTKLGDPIEIEGLTKAFRRYTQRRGFCAISSVKTNIGHLVGAAGFAGLSKVVLSLKTRQLFPSLHFQNANSFIDFANSPFFVNTELRPWQAETKKPRIAAVSSFGLSGTNAHLVLEEAPKRSRKECPAAPVLLTLSARSLPALQRYMQQMAAFLRESDESMAEISYTMNLGRNDYAYRYAIVIASAEDGAARLEEAAKEMRTHTGGVVAGRSSLVLLLGADAHAGRSHYEHLLATSPAFADAVSRCCKIAGESVSAATQQFMYLYAIHQMWSSSGLTFRHLIGNGVGNFVVQVIQGKRRLDQALLELNRNAPDPAFDLRKLQGVLEEIEEDDESILLEAGQSSSLSRSIQELETSKDRKIAFTLSGDDGHSILTALAGLYIRGVSIDWQRFYQGGSYCRIEAPTYPFEPIRCWLPVEQRQLPAVPERPAVMAEAPAQMYGVIDEEATATEKALARVWGEVLKQNTLSADTDYFAIGGNSLEGMQVLKSIESQFGVKLEFEAICDYPTVRALAAHIEDQKVSLADSPGTAARSALAAATASGPFVLSSGQERLWFLYRLEPGSAFYHLSFCVKITGLLNVTTLEASLSEIVRRHHNLRTVYPMQGGVPAAVVRPAGPVDLGRFDFSSLPLSEARTRSMEAATGESRRPFDLAIGPMLRVSLAQVTGEEWLLIVAMHHIISDAWSLGNLIREMATLYTAYLAKAASPLAELPVQYSDYARQQRQSLESSAIKRDVDYWQEHLANTSAALELPYDFRPPAQRTTQGERYEFLIPAPLVRNLEELSASAGTTLFMTLLASFQILLYRYSGQHDFCIGTPVAGRTDPDVEQMIGFFVNTLVIRGRFDGDPTCRELLGRVRRTVLDAFVHQRAPFDEVVKRLYRAPDLTRNPLFQVMFMLQNIAMEMPELPGLAWEILYPGTVASEFDLVFSLLENRGSLSGRIDYAADLFRRATIQRLVEHFQNVLEQVVSNPLQRVSEISILRNEERQELLSAGAGPAVSSDAQCVSQLVEEQAERTPQAKAIIFNGGCWTYRELEERSNQLARYLKRMGVGPESVVAIAVHRSPELLSGLLGILKAGGAYLPLDVEYPAERLKWMVQDAGAQVVLAGSAEQRVLQAAGALDARTVVDLDADGTAIGRESGERLHCQARETNLAYVIYTSGSTGVPKGVMVDRSSLGNFVLGISNLMELVPGDRILQFASISFDASAVQIYPALARGAAVVLHPAPNRLSNQELLALCEQQEVSIVDLPGGFWRQWIQDLAAHHQVPYPKLRAFMTGGESMSRPVVDLWRKIAGPQSRLLNSYGPTEATVTTTVYATTRESAEPSEGMNEIAGLGRPLENNHLYVLDRNLHLSPKGSRGEIYIGGKGVARGYLNDPMLTAQRFLPDPYSGEAGARMYRTGDMARRTDDNATYFLGRNDEQVKIRGFRIELKEVESVLRQCPDVAETVVVEKRDSRGEGILVAYVSALAPAKVDPEAVRRFARQRLPEHMTPSRFVVLPSMPFTANAKIDRKALPDPGLEPAIAFVPPRTAVEQKLSELWCGVLGLPEIGITQNFFELGGHSLLATQVISRVQDVFGVEVPLRSLFESPTIATFATCVENGTKAPEDRIPVIPRTRALPLSFSQERFWFLEQLEPSSGRLNIPNAVLLKGKLDFSALKKSLAAIMARHESLRTAFSSDHGQPRQFVVESANADLTFVDLSSLSHLQQLQETERLIRQQALLPFNLANAPLLRSHLAKLREDEHLLVLTIHHIVFDGWSLSVLMEDLFTLYEALRAGVNPHLPELPIQYADYAHWQRQNLTGDRLEELFDYWKNQLADAPTSIALPIDGVSLAYGKSARHTFSVNRGTMENLRSFSEQEGVTLFVTLLAAFSCVLYSLSRQEDMVIGTDVANRTRLETERLIGCFFNHLPLRVNLSRNPSFRELAKRVHETVLSGVAHGAMPFHLLVQRLQPNRVNKRSPLFQVLFVYQSAPAKDIQWNSLRPEPLEIEGGDAKLDLTVFLKPEKDGVEGVIEYDRGMFRAETVSQIANQYLQQLQAGVQNPDGSLQILCLPQGTDVLDFALEFNDRLG